MQKFVYEYAENSERSDGKLKVCAQIISDDMR